MAPPVRLGDLIPDFKGPSLALGDRLDEEFVARATRRLDAFENVLFTADDGTVEVTGAAGGTRTSYLLDPSNRIQFGTSFGYIAVADSKARFEAARALLEGKFGKPSSGARQGTEMLTLDWISPDGTARLDLEANSANQVWLRTTIARTGGPDRYYPPRPRDEGNGGDGGNGG